MLPGLIVVLLAFLPVWSARAEAPAGREVDLRSIDWESLPIEEQDRRLLEIGDPIINPASYPDGWDPEYYFVRKYEAHKRLVFSSLVRTPEQHNVDRGTMRRWARTIVPTLMDDCVTTSSVRALQEMLNSSEGLVERPAFRVLAEFRVVTDPGPLELTKFPNARLWAILHLLSSRQGDTMMREEAIRLRADKIASEAPGRRGNEHWGSFGDILVYVDAPRARELFLESARMAFKEGSSNVEADYFKRFPLQPGTIPIPMMKNFLVIHREVGFQTYEEAMTAYLPSAFPQGVETRTVRYQKSGEFPNGSWLMVVLMRAYGEGTRRLGQLGSAPPAEVFSGVVQDIDAFRAKIAERRKALGPAASKEAVEALDWMDVETATVRKEAILQRDRFLPAQPVQEGGR